MFLKAGFFPAFLFGSTHLDSFCKTSRPHPFTEVTLRTLKNQRGQGLIEYLIVVALIAVATIGVMRVVGQAVGTRFATISDALQGNRKEHKVDAIDEKLLKRRDLGDFMNGVGAGERHQ
jgi:Flp pilus assembly pilin Flp